MKLQDFATEIKAANNFIKASFGGFAGSGKTRTGAEFVIGAYKHLNCKKPILIIDNEKGSRFLVPLFKQSGIEVLVKDTIELGDVLKSFEYLNEGEIDFLFIDSLSKIWYKYVRDYKKNNNRVFMTLQDWGKILPAWQEDFSDKYVGLEGNCVFTGRGGFTYDMEENEKGKKEFVKSGVKMKMAGETPFEPDINVWMDINQKIVDDKPVVWREAMIMKDRSGLIDGKTFKNPVYEDFRPVVNYLINVPKGKVSKATYDQNLAPKENYDYQNRKDLISIELENISALFNQYKFSSGAEDKRYKVLISKKFFGTASGTELEKIKPDFLRDRRIALESFLERWNEAENKEIYIESYAIPLDFDAKENNKQSAKD